MRRTLLIGILALILLGVGVWIYFIYFGTQGSGGGAPNTTLPFATSTNPSTNTPVGNPPITEPSAPTKVTPRLVQIDKGPVVAGEAVFAPASSTSAVSINYIERQSGNVFQYNVGEEKLTRISNRTIPGIQEAQWVPDGSLAFVRYLGGEDHSTISTYGLPSNGGNGYFLAQNITDLSVRNSGVLAVGSNTNGSVGTFEKINGSNAKQVFTSPLSSLRAGFLGATQYLVFTKPSATLAGYVFVVNSTGNFERVAGPLSGLVALPSPSGAWALISYTSSGTIKTSLLDINTKTLTPLPIATIADKCVWTASSKSVYCGVPIEPSSTYAYPDDWYQGAVSFSDRIWKIDVQGRFAELTLDFAKDTKSTLDATALAIDPSEKVLVFKNKTDGSLWSYQL